MIDKAKSYFENKWGIFNHYLYHNICAADRSNNLGTGITDWNTAVERFDVEKLAYNLHRMNAKYYFITLMQGSKHMLAPNSTFDMIAGTKPGEACATRDLPMDLYHALSAYGIDLCLYYTGDGPHSDRPIGKKFGFDGDAGDGSNVDAEFCKKWSSVLEEYAVRYGDKVKAWWIDGSYRDTLGYTDELMEFYYNAVKKGNPDAAVAFNGGISSINLTKNFIREEYTAGECNQFSLIPEEKYVDGALSHVLAPLGYNSEADRWWMWCGWGRPGLKHTKEYLRDYIRKINHLGGAVTVDICVNIDGSFDAEQQNFLNWVGNNL